MQAEDKPEADLGEGAALLIGEATRKGTKLNSVLYLAPS